MTEKYSFRLKSGKNMPGGGGYEEKVKVGVRINGMEYGNMGFSHYSANPLFHHSLA